MNNEQKLAQIFRQLASEHITLTKRQEEFAIKEIGRIRGELAEILAEYSDSDGIVKRNRIGTLMRELDTIESHMREYGNGALDDIITESSDWTVGKINGALTNIVGSSVLASQFDTINREVFRYVTKRFAPDGLVLSDRVWALSADIREQLSSVIRSSIIRGESVNTLIPKIRQVYDNETWKIRRLAATESNVAYRAATASSAKNSGIVEYVKLTAGRKRSRRCVELASADPYGLGTGIYRPGDSIIYSPHPNCTSYITYVLDPRYL